MNRPFLFWLCYQPYKWLVLYPFMVLSTFFFAALAILLASTVSQRLGSMIAGKYWARVIAMLTPMSVDLQGTEHIDSNKSYVIVSNHQSLYDIFVLYGWLPVDFKWVMKHELRKLPALGSSCEKLGHIFIDRSNRTRAIATLNEAKQRIVNGTSVIFFPEGTRSLGKGLRPFKKGAFHMAIELGLPILPLSILGTRDIQPAKSFDTYPGRATMLVHEPIPVEMFKDNVEGLMTEARQAIAFGLGEAVEESARNQARA